uniref:Uncharacterized protein n=1 Tax=Brassica campestris TaxID=3711 RepID=A0A3P6CMY9_BRACM|nr:unnamed protein product [Brassica rapa]
MSQCVMIGAKLSMKGFTITQVHHQVAPLVAALARTSKKWLAYKALQQTVRENI